MLIIKKRFILFFIMLFVMTAVVFAMPVMAFAQEEESGTVEDEEIVEPAPEKITIDINYHEVSGHGLVGERFEFQMDITYDGKEARLFEFVKDAPGGWSIEITPMSLDIDILHPTSQIAVAHRVRTCV